MRKGRGHTYENALNIFTDGSCKPHPRRGGVAVRFVVIDQNGLEVCRDLDLQGHDGATNNQMELLAVVLALQEAASAPEIDGIERIVVFSDSRYVIDNWKSALFYWSQQRWQNKDGRPIENASLWRDLIRAVRVLRERHRKQVNLEWVKGHKANVHNRAADKLAKKSADEARHAVRRTHRIRRKTTNNLTLIGSVEMKGQRLRIRIVEESYLALQRLNRYRYEVLSPNSKYVGKIDIVFSEHAMWAGHTYDVQLNRQSGNPRVLRVVREVVSKKAAADDEKENPE